jgi:hypothetical protein
LAESVSELQNAKAGHEICVIGGAVVAVDGSLIA